MEKKTLEILFTNRIFYVPNYQRDYAWLVKNVDDLFDDIKEAIETTTKDYIGTFILSKASGPIAQSLLDGLPKWHTGGTELTSSSTRKTPVSALHAIVDGQQRLTTLSVYEFCECQQRCELPYTDHRV